MCSSSFSRICAHGHFFYLILGQDDAGNTVWREDGLPPWFRFSSFIKADPLISLSNEILDLCDLLQATKQEENDTGVCNFIVV